MNTQAALAYLAEQDYPLPLAYWREHGTLLLCADGKVRFRSDARPEELEDWPVGASNPHPELVRVRRIADDIIRDGLKGMDVLPALAPFVESAKASQDAADKREKAAREAEARERQTRDEKVAALRAKYENATRGWRKGKFIVAHPNNVRVECEGLLGPGLSPVDGHVFAIDKADGMDEHRLTHVASGMRVVTGSPSDLKILAARLLDVPGMDWTLERMPRAMLTKASKLVCAFKLSKNPWTLED